MAAIAFLFPDGTFPTRRHRVQATVGAVAVGVLVVAEVWTYEQLDAPFAAVEPYGIEAPWVWWVWTVARHRLYDIERLISRTVGYAVLTPVIVAAYAAAAVPIGVALGRGSAWSTAAGTLAAAVAFGPVRTRVQRRAAGWFDPTRHRAVAEVERFVEPARDGTATPEGIGATLAGALGDPGARLLYWLPESGLHVDSDGSAVGPGSRPRGHADPAGGPGSRGLRAVARRDSTLVVEVADDGRGGASSRPGSGLHGLGDRVEALGGTLAHRQHGGRGHHRPRGPSTIAAIAIGSPVKKPPCGPR